ncbi:MAG: HD domain-containing protein [Spirochaetes bacterium]|nr:HD domain-containing protein [Spirochaetota bacterium]
MIASISNKIFLELLVTIESHKGISREYPLEWEYVHASSTAQIGRLLALKRMIDPELAAIACYLHDVGRIITGKQEGHAKAGEKITRKILSRHNIDSNTVENIVAAIINHSAKEKIGSPLEELVKDADVIDCALYGIVFQKEGFITRLSNCQKELGIALPTQNKNK